MVSIGKDYMISEGKTAHYECDGCGGYFAPQEMGYIGPKDRNDTSCHPFMVFENLCETCEEEKNGTTSKKGKTGGESS